MNESNQIESVIRSNAITLMSLDNKEFTINRSLIKHSETLTEMFSDIKVNNSIPIALNSDLLSKLVASLEKINSIATMSIPELNQIINTLDPIFIHLSLNQLIELLKEANRLNIKILMDYIINHIVIMLTDKSTNISVLSDLAQHLNDENILPKDLYDLIFNKFKSVDPKYAELDFDSKKLDLPFARKNRDILLSCSSTNVLVNEMGTISLWDIENSKLISKFEDGDIVTFSSSGEQVVISYLRGFGMFQYQLLDLKTGKNVKKFEDPSVFNNFLDLVHKFDRLKDFNNYFHPCNYAVILLCDCDNVDTALARYEDGSIRLWNLRTNKIVNEFRSHSKIAARKIVISSDRQYALTAYWSDKTAILWNLNQKNNPLEPNKKLIGHTDCITTLAFSPDGKYALTGSCNNEVSYWDLASGTTIKALKDNHSEVISAAISCDGKYALTGAWDGKVRYWDLETGETIKVLEDQFMLSEQVAFTPNNHYALAYGRRDLYLWNLHKRRLSQLILLTKLEQQSTTVLKDHYFKQVFDDLPGIVKRKYQMTSRIKPFILIYAKPIAIGVSLAAIVLGSYLISRSKRHAISN